MSDTNYKVKNIISLNYVALLGIAFVVLKLCHVIDWAWLWVLCPFWIGIPIFFVIMFVLIITAIIVNTR